MSIPIRRKFEEVPLTAIRPEGWLRNYLKKQSRGLTGHMEVAGYPFNTKGWACAKVAHRRGEPWWPYEQVGYWIDGMARCGYLLGDKRLIGKAKKSIDYVLKHADSDGYLGPKHLKEAKHWNRWSHAVFFRALMAYYSATNDRRVLKALTKHYLSKSSEHCNGRDICNIEIMLWVYSKTGGKRLLNEAERAYDKYNQQCDNDDTTMANMLSGKRASEHGVTYNEIAKLGAILYMYTGKKKYLVATENAYRKIDRYHMLIDGVCSSSEHLKGKDALDSHETCDIADYTWSVGYLLCATGRAEYADKIERACFNAAPGAVTEDFKALQYFSCPNQVIADKSSNHNIYERGNAAMSYRPNPYTQCCPGEVHRIMPNFAARMWLKDADNTIVASLYGPSEITVKLGGKKVVIVEETDYPFNEQIDFKIKIHTKWAVSFTLGLRIPGWCRKAQVLVNGKQRRGKLEAGSFIKIRRNFKHNDRVSLILPMELKMSYWPGGGVALERGPLVYALGIKEDRKIDKQDRRSSEKFPAWNMYPASRWNYALDIDRHNLKEVEVVRGPVSADPWRVESTPIQLRVQARRVRNWKIVRKKQIASEITPGKVEKLSGDFAFTPALPEPGTLTKRLGKKTETITLVPYGCTNLRVAIFPKC